VSDTRAASLRWVEDGTARVDHALLAVPGRLDEPTALPGWSRRHVLAHLAANADALANLVTWARTGVVTPMYGSAEERVAGIEQGLHLPDGELVDRVRDSAADLERGWWELDEAHWSTEVVTAQGRTVRADVVPWLRAREVFVHLVDLDVGTGFADLPEDFLRALRADVRNKRGEVHRVRGRLADEVAWLTGRPHGLVDAPVLTPWL
jgi:maleylpyruvate isomerase